MQVASFFAVLFLLAAQSSPQQTPTADAAIQVTVTRDPQSLSLLAQCSSSMGASGVIPDIYAEGTITPTNPKSPSASVVLKSKGTDRVRTEISSTSGGQTHVINNGRGFSLISGQRKNLAAHATAYFRPEHLSAYACSIDVARTNVSVSYVGLENLAAASVHHVIFHAASSDPLDQLISEFHVYLDTKTLRVVKTANWAFAPDAIENRSLWETYYDNYQPVAGVLVPMHISHFVAGSKLDDWNFTSVLSDVRVADGEFN
jgi:hypothetical protein